MDITTVTIDKVRDIQQEIRDEHDEALDQGDTPEYPQTDYYSSAHRANVEIIDQHGNSVTLDATDDNLATLRPIEDTVNEAIRNAGGYVTPGTPWRFSPYAGCSCPCSPGFLVENRGFDGKNPGGQYQAFVTVTVQH